MDDELYLQELADSCKSHDNKTNEEYDRYKKIVDLILEGNFETKDKIAVLVEMFRYSYYKSAERLLGPGTEGSNQTFADFCFAIEKSLSENKISKELIENLKGKNDMLRAYIDVPLNFIKCNYDFYKENPDMMF